VTVCDGDDVFRQIAVREFLERLADREREVVLLTARGFKASDVAKKIGISVANVYQIVHRIRTKARNLL
jgi:RNA polymerase sigma factor (sigma-70 family)